MAGTAVLCLEGVLCKGSPPNGAPITVGLEMYHALAARFRVVLDSDHEDLDQIEHWCQVNGLKRHPLVLPLDAAEAPLEPVDVRLAHLAEWRAQGFEVALYVTADPTVAAAAMRQGVTTLLFAHPRFARPEYRPDHEQQAVRPWDEIEDEITKQMALRETVPRIDAEMDFDG